MPGKDDGKQKGRHRKRAPMSSLPPERFQTLLESAGAWEKPSSDTDDRIREKTIVELLLSRGASIAEAIRWCESQGVTVTRRFVAARRDALKSAEPKTPGSTRPVRRGGFEE